MNDASGVQVDGGEPELLEQARRQVEAALDLRPGGADAEHLVATVILDLEADAAGVG